MAMREMQYAYQMAQNSRVTTEVIRSCNVNQMVGGMGGADFASSAMLGGGPQAQIADIPPAEKCIGQVVLDWEFIHDLDLHLLKVTAKQNGKGSGRGGGYFQNPEPNPEPSPEPVDAVPDLNTLINPETNELHLEAIQQLKTVVFYGNKICSAAGSDTPQAALQLDRNAGVHSHKPVENLYLTEKLEPGIYVVGVHNYSQRQLQENVIASTQGQYTSFEEFQKADPGYQLMEKALSDQITHANDEDGTPEKLAIMTKVDQDMAEGSRMLQGKCSSGSGSHGVHYGVAVYTYPDQALEPTHPQAASPEELRNLFKSEFFATADCVFNPDANPTRYNAANVLADITTADGAKALSQGKAAHVALLKVAKDHETGNARIEEVRMLRGMPRADLAGAGGASPAIPGNAMNMLRMQRMQGATQQMVEPFPEPSMQMTSSAISQFQQTGPEFQQIQMPQMLQPQMQMPPLAQAPVQQAPQIRQPRQPQMQLPPQVQQQRQPQQQMQMLPQMQQQCQPQMQYQTLRAPATAAPPLTANATASLSQMSPQANPFGAAPARVAATAPVTSSNSVPQVPLNSLNRR